MTIYTPTGPFVSGSAPGIDAPFLNAQENAIVAAGSIYFLSSPVSLTTNPTVTSGAVSTLTCSPLGGAGGVPTGAKGVLIGGGIFAVTTGGYLWISPHSATAGQYVGWAGMPSNAFTPGFIIVPLDVTGKIDVKANSSNIVLQSWYIYGYIM